MPFDFGAAAGGFGEAAARGFAMQESDRIKTQQLNLQKRHAALSLLSSAREQMNGLDPDQQKQFMQMQLVALQKQGVNISPALAKMLTSDPQGAVNYLTAGALSVPSFAENFDQIISSDEIVAQLIGPMMKAMNQRRNLTSVFGGGASEGTTPGVPTPAPAPAGAPMVANLQAPPATDLQAPPAADLAPPAAQAMPVSLQAPGPQTLAQGPSSPTAAAKPSGSPIETRRTALLDQMTRLNSSLAAGRLSAAEAKDYAGIIQGNLNALNALNSQEDRALGTQLGVDPNTREGQTAITNYKRDQGIESKMRDVAFDTWKAVQEAGIKDTSKIRDRIIEITGVDPGTPGATVSAPGLSISIPGAPGGGRVFAGEAEREQQRATAQQTGKATGEAFTGLTAAGDAARSALPILRRMAGMEFVSGPLAGPLRGGIDSVAGVFGINTKNKTDQQIFEALGNRLVFSELGGKLGTGISEGDRSFVEKMFPRITTEPEARRQLIQFYTAAQERKLQIAQAAREFVAGRREGGLSGELTPAFYERLDKFVNAKENQIRLRVAGGGE